MVPIRKELDAFAAACDALIALSAHTVLSAEERRIVVHYLSELLVLHRML